MFPAPLCCLNIACIHSARTLNNSGIDFFFSKPLYLQENALIIDQDWCRNQKSESVLSQCFSAKSILSQYTWAKAILSQNYSELNDSDC